MATISMTPLGATGLSVSTVGIGASPLGSVPELYGYAVDDRQAEATIEAAFAGPLNFIDTSNNYGEGRSETRIGRVIARHGGVPEGVVLATKVDADAVTGEFSGDRVRRSFAESTERLGVERIELLYLHDPEFYLTAEQIVAPGGPLEALLELRESGLVGHIGLAAGDVTLMRKLVHTGAFEVVLNHNRFTLLDRSAEQLMDETVASGAAFVNAAPYGGGILARGPASRSSYCYREANDVVMDRAVRMHDACDRSGVPLAAAALQFSMRDPRVSSTIVGVSSPERIAETITLAQLEIPVELWAELESLLPPREYWLD